jgi:copper(I)-binding protein
VSDPWARAAAMTGASASGDANMGQSSTMTNTAAMSSTTTMGATAAASGGTSAAYLTITNSGGTADSLLKAESDVADSVELHTMTMQDNVMKMSPVEKIAIPANGKAELKPGGFHVMLIGLRHDLKEGEVVKITLTFQNSGKIEVEAPVRKP